SDLSQRARRGFARERVAPDRDQSQRGGTALAASAVHPGGAGRGIANRARLSIRSRLLLLHSGRGPERDGPTKGCREVVPPGNPSLREVEGRLPTVPPRQLRERSR